MGFEHDEEATILSIALAVMASSGRWKKIVVAEIGKQHYYEKIRHYYNAKRESICEEFYLDQILFVPNSTIEVARKWAATEDVFLVIDCGNNIELFEEVKHLCHRKILICSLLPWNISKVSNYLGQKRQEWNSILVKQGKRQIKEVEKKTKCNLHFWPGIEDPFYLSVNTMSELYQLTQGKKYITNKEK